ncbi:MAG TPA: EamA family transporter [Nocardioidaceae bacterium]|nr:EamA family transporter [Nocardioidaceae bacterium]
MTSSDTHAGSRVTSAALVLSGAALFGTIGTAQALGPDVPTPQLAAVRLLLGALLLMLAAVVTGLFSVLSTSLRQAPTWFAGISQVAFNLCFLGAMTEAGVAVGTLVAIGATPILTGLFTRQVSWLWVLATAVAVTGLVLLVVGQLASASPPSAVGILLAFGAAASYATYIVSGNVAAARNLDTQSYLAVAFSISALVAAPLLLCGDVSWVASVDGAALVIYLAVFATLVAYSLFNRGLRGVHSSTASTLALIEPVVAAGLAYALLGETLGLTGLLGAVLILLGLLLIVRSVATTGQTVRRGPQQREAVVR